MPNLKVVNPDMQEYDEKIKKHRMRIVTIAIAIVVAVVAIAGIIYIINKEMQFGGYNVNSSYENIENSSAKYFDFKGNILKCSNDGISYYNKNNGAIWTQAYEMQEPMVDICGDYVVEADRLGSEIYIQNSASTVGKIDISMKIEKIKVSANGNIMAIVADNETKYLKYYNLQGELIAEGKIQMKKSGYAVDYDLSDDGKKLVVSYLYVSNGIVKTNIVFYNFDTVGQNEIDNIVSSYSYDDTVVPEVEFFGNDRIIAFGDRKVYIFEGTQKPQLKTEIEVESEIKSVFYNDTYFGLITKNEDDEYAHKALCYKLNGSKAAEFGFSVAYDDVQFANDNIVMNSENNIAIFKLNGNCRYEGTLEDTILKIIPTTSTRKYVFITQSAIENITMY